MSTSATAIAVALVLLSGCASEQEQTPLDGGGRIAYREEGDAEAQAALSAALAAWRSGDSLAALAIATSALRASPPPDIETQLREIRVKAREAIVGGKVARLRVVPRRDAVATGEAVDVDVVFRNLSAAPLRIPRTDSGSSVSLIVLDVIRTDVDVYGNTRNTEITARLPLLEDLVLAPGAQVSLPAPLGTDISALAHQGFAVLSVGGTMRPVAIRVGQTEFFDSLPIEAAPVRIFMQGYEQLAADPLPSLKKAVKKRSPPHILTAAELLPPEHRAEAIAFLEDAAERDPDLAFACNAAAARLRTFIEP